MPPIDYERAAAITQYLENQLTNTLTTDTSRRTVLGGLGVAGAAAMGLPTTAGAHTTDQGDQSPHGNFGSVGEYESNQFDPHDYLTNFDTGERDGDVREFDFTAVDSTAEIAPGVGFDTWAFNRQVPGPTIRVTEGDRIRINFTNGGEHAHTIHPHLKNLNPAMDGVPQNGPGVLETGESFTYEWQAKPPGVHLYHCHSLPLKEHIHRGLYGTIIVDPDPNRVKEHPEEYVRLHETQITDGLVDYLVEEAKTRNHEYPENDDVNEMVIVMNSFDTDFDGENEVYAANTRAFAYGVAETNGFGEWEAGETIRPITIDRTKRQRVYLVNVTEFDPINSFHTHSQFFDYYDHGSTLLPTYQRIDTVMQCQAQRGIIELDYSDHDPGLYMFHAHQSEFAELGWMSFFEVV